MIQEACLVILWKGHLPSERLYSLRQLVATGCHVYFISDHPVSFAAPNFFQQPLPDRLAFDEFSVEVDLTRAAGYKLVDFKIFIWACLGAITARYECWGFADVDVIYNSSIGDRMLDAVQKSKEDARAQIFGDRGHFMMFSKHAGAVINAHIQDEGHLAYLQRALCSARAHLLDEFRFGHKIFALMHQRGAVIWHQDHFQPLVDISYWSRLPSDTRRGAIDALYMKDGVIFARMDGHDFPPMYVHIQKRFLNAGGDCEGKRENGYFKLLNSGGLVNAVREAPFRSSWWFDVLYRFRMIRSRIKAKIMTEIL